jgi:hypothetical protein
MAAQLFHFKVNTGLHRKSGLNLLGQCQNYLRSTEPIKSNQAEEIGTHMFSPEPTELIKFSDSDVNTIRHALEAQLRRMENDLKTAGDKAPVWLIVQINKTRVEIKRILEKL